MGAMWAIIWRLVVVVNKLCKAANMGNLFLGDDADIVLNIPFPSPTNTMTAAWYAPVSGRITLFATAHAAAYSRGYLLINDAEVWYRNQYGPTIMPVMTWDIVAGTKLNLKGSNDAACWTFNPFYVTFTPIDQFEL